MIAAREVAPEGALEDTRTRWWVFLPVGIALALVGYKALSATARLSSGVPPAMHTGDAVHRTWIYLAAIWPALAFGVLIAATMRAFVPTTLMLRMFRGGARGQIVAAATATPLMLCACCAAPLFTGLYERTRRAAPSLALALGAPSLNIAAIAFTFLLLGPLLGVTRIAIAVVLTTGGAVLATRLARLDADAGPVTAAPEASGHDPSLPGFLRALVHVGVRTIPVIVVGVLASSAISANVSAEAFEGMRSSLVAIPLVALFVLPLALPTFFELPLALTLLATGFPPGVAAAVLIAGPATNLASLFTIARTSSWRLAASVAFVVFLAAVMGGAVVALVAG